MIDGSKTTVVVPKDKKAHNRLAAIHASKTLSNHIDYHYSASITKGVYEINKNYNPFPKDNIIRGCGECDSRPADEKNSHINKIVSDISIIQKDFSKIRGSDFNVVVSRKECLDLITNSADDITRSLYFKLENLQDKIDKSIKYAGFAFAALGVAAAYNPVLNFVYTKIHQMPNIQIQTYELLKSITEVSLVGAGLFAAGIAGRYIGTIIGKEYNSQRLETKKDIENKIDILEVITIKSAEEHNLEIQPDYKSSKKKSKTKSKSLRSRGVFA